MEGGRVAGVQVMKTRNRVLGEEQPSTLRSMNNLAFPRKSQGRLSDALELMQNCLHLRQQVLGSDNPDIVSTRSILNNWLNKKANGKSWDIGIIVV